MAWVYAAVLNLSFGPAWLELECVEYAALNVLQLRRIAEA
jgi:hypothetical protein